MDSTTDPLKCQQAKSRSKLQKSELALLVDNVDFVVSNANGKRLARYAEALGPSLL